MSVALGGEVPLSDGVVDGGEWTASVQLLPGQATVVTATCADAVGNEATATATRHLDVEAPTIDLVPWPFRSEEKAKVSYEDDVLTVNFAGLPSTNAVSACVAADESTTECDEIWSKFTATLGAADPNVVAFGFAITDQGSSLPSSALDITYSFERDGTVLTESAPVPSTDSGFFIPLTVDTMTDQDAGSFAWTPASVPNTLVVTAVDLAGNETERTIHFTLQLLAPPVKLTALSTWDVKGHDAAGYELAGTALADIGLLFGATPPPLVASQGGTRVARYLVSNPTSVSIEFSASKLPLTVVTDRHRAFVATSVAPCLAADCIKGNCTTSYSATATCGPLYTTSSTTTLDEVLPATVRAFPMSELDAIDPSPAPLTQPLGTVVLQPGEQFVLDVLAETASTCLIGQAEVFETLGGNTRRIHVANKSCNSFSGPDTTDDTATCTEDAPNVFPLWGCLVAEHAAPLALTALRIGTLAGTQLKVQHYVPGFTAPVFSQTYPVDVTFEAVADTLSLAP
ncbi:MAG: hypothetical protein ACI9WU_003361 [Myxococcota bacterium]